MTSLWTDAAAAAMVGARMRRRRAAGGMTGVVLRREQLVALDRIARHEHRSRSAVLRLLVEGELARRAQATQERGA